MTDSSATTGPTGYSDAFLPVRVPLPAPHDATAVRELAYTHFTVLLDTDRRLARATAVNIDGGALLDVGRGDDWHLDPRVPADQQTGPEVYARNDLDRGHLVRRRDPVWGSATVAGRANVDTFSYTNAAPQAAGFNQSKELWLGLEDYILNTAQASGERLSVFTGPVLADDDQEYRGVQLPRLFWKVAAWVTTEGAADATTGSTTDTAQDAAPALAATAYVLDQTPQLGQIDLEQAVAARPDVPLLGPYRTFQVPVADVASLSGLDLGPLPTADRFSVARALTAGARGWLELDALADIQL
ncbi:DNA/RNA non-specific endonuclease [Compostimonas suwonensis]|uniref:Endonuclease G n=1 Tax=Compostimonas suwonensis TaxID=1048394 RepID=A0A2M9BVY7_9MICO|nr:DNA/RNA non-specific endonuclease [Compostimonas suwonensis]PJJ62110.1 endonuclease G [Compostimonas suwonensis]